jgi:hypothetical protein
VAELPVLVLASVYGVAVDLMNPPG